MAHQSVPSFNSNVHPIFQQLLDNLVATQIQRVNRILGSCCYDRCRDDAQVSDLETGCGYCRSHFREVSRG